jgi:hypothetical protein
MSQPPSARLTQTVRPSSEICTPSRIRHRGNPARSEATERTSDRWQPFEPSQINDPYEFNVRRHCGRPGRRVLGWYPLPKGVAFLPRSAAVAMTANHRYLDAWRWPMIPTAPSG